MVLHSYRGPITTKGLCSLKFLSLRILRVLHRVFIDLIFPIDLVCHVLAEEFLLHACVGLLVDLISVVTFTTIALHLIELVLHVQVLHVVDILGGVHLLRRHWERLLVQKRNHSLLAQHQFNHSFSFMLVEFVVLIECGIAGIRTRATNSAHVRLRVNQIDTDAETWLRRILLLLSLSLVLLPFRFYFVDCLLKQDLKFSLRGQLLVVLETGCLEQSALMLHHLPKFFHDTIVAE